MVIGRNEKVGRDGFRANKKWAKKRLGEMANGQDRYWVKREKGELGKGEVGVGEMGKQLGEMGMGEMGLGEMGINQFKLRAPKTLKLTVISRTAGHVFSFVLYPLTQLAVNIDILFPRFVSLFI
jgi:hypothetical protein